MVSGRPFRYPRVETRKGCRDRGTDAGNAGCSTPIHDIPRVQGETVLRRDGSAGTRGWLRCCKKRRGGLAKVGLNDLTSASQTPFPWTITLRLGTNRARETFFWIFAQVRTSHVSVSSHQFVAGGVKGVDTEYEEGSVPEAVCLPLQGLDLVVCPFEWSGGYGVIIVRRYTSTMSPEGVGEVFEYTYTGYLGPVDPVLEMGFGGRFVRQRPQKPEIFLHVICRRQRFVDAQCLFEASPFVAVVPEVLGILQKQPPGPLEDLPVEQISGLPIQFSTQIAQFLVEELDHVEMIEHDSCAGQ